METSELRFLIHFPVTSAWLSNCKPKPNGENTLLALGDKLLESSLELIFAIAFIILVLKMLTNIHQ